MSFIYVKYEDIDIDYTPWLGKNWSPPKEAQSLMISNHRGSMVNG
jgi:hypothetical protein